MKADEALRTWQQLRAAESAIAENLIRSVQAAIPGAKADAAPPPAEVKPAPPGQRHGEGMAAMALAYVDAQEDLPVTTRAQMTRMLREYVAQTENFLLWSVQRWALRERAERERTRQARAVARAGRRPTGSLGRSV